EEPVAHLAVVLLDQHERLVDQAGEQLEDLVRTKDQGPRTKDGWVDLPFVIRLSSFVVSADRLGGLQAPATGDDGKPPQQRSLLVGEQIVAPIDGGAERLLPRQGGAAAAGEE